MKHNRLTSAKRWLKQHKKPVTYISLGVGGLMLFGSFLLAVRVDDAVTRTDPSGAGEASEPELSFIASPLTGVEVSPDLANRPVTAVMVENSPDARPQSGLDKAGVIYEAIAEGGITRFITFFQEATPQVIGPVRSVRPYFLDFARQFDAPIAHVGGSSQALNQIRKLRMRDLDEFANPGAYWRDSRRFAPHNAYTSFDNLDKLNESKGYNKSEFEPLPRKDADPAKKPTATNITINVSSYLYNPVYKYHKQSNTYRRSLGGSPHKDRETGKQLSPDVVVVLQMNQSVIDSVGHLGITTKGSNKAWIFQDGNVIKGKWSRRGDNQIVLTRGANKEVKLNKGQTWFTVLPSGNTVEY